MKTKLFIAVLTCCVSLMALPMAQAQNTVPPAASDIQKSGQQPPREDRPTGEKPWDKLKKELDLTTDQQAKIKETFVEAHPKMKALHDDTTLSPKERHEKMRAIRESIDAKIRPLLTTEQAQKFDELQAKMKAGHGPRN